VTTLCDEGYLQGRGQSIGGCGVLYGRTRPPQLSRNNWSVVLVGQEDGRRVVICGTVGLDVSQAHVRPISKFSCSTNGRL